MNHSGNESRLPDDLPADPMHWADAWIKEASTSELQRHSNAMTLITAATDGQPSSRIVLCKELVPDPGYLVFYTNYESRKAREITGNSKVAAQFHWDAIGRQVRIEGIAVHSPGSESDRYFATRDAASQLGAWGSDQSEPIESRRALIAQIRERAADLGLSLDVNGEPLGNHSRTTIERPPHWGGYRLWATAIELWMEGEDRIHDRAVWRRQILRSSDHEFSTTRWKGTRIQP